MEFVLVIDTTTSMLPVPTLRLLLMSPNKYSVILGNLGNTCDRFLPTGYKQQPPKAEMIKLAGSIDGIAGLELVGGWDVTPENSSDLHKLMQDESLACVSIIPDLFSRSEIGRAHV